MNSGAQKPTPALGATEVVVKVMDKPYTITCPNDKVQELQNSAAYVDTEMRKIREAGKVVGSERIAVLVALNVAYDLLTGQQITQTTSSQLTEKVDVLHQKLSQAVAKLAETGHTN